MILLSNIKRWGAKYIQKVFLSHETSIDVDNLPLYQYQEDEVEFVFYTSNNMIKTPHGYFRFCWQHEPYNAHKRHMQSFFDVVCKDSNSTDRDRFIAREMTYWKNHRQRTKFQTYNANKIMAEEAVAKMVGLDRLLTQTHFCKMRIGGGEELIGTMMSEAGGLDVRLIKDRYKESITPQLVCELDNLNILDAICHEQDHRPGNYHLLLDENGNAVSVRSFDNDSPWAFSPFGKICFKTYENASFLIQNGMINRPFVDETVSKRILELDRQTFQQKLSPYLNSFQLWSCWKRFSQLQCALEKSHALFRKKDDWNDDIVKQELSGQYGRTYIVILCDLLDKIKNE